MKNFFQKFTPHLLLGLTAIVASLLSYSATPAGVGLTNDSAAYIGGARSILNGTGYSDIWLMPPYEPITHYPPLYSMILAGGGMLGVDPIRAARALNILLFGLNTYLTGYLVWLVTRKILFTLWASLIFISTVMFLRVHVYAMSEALFLAIMLGAILTLRAYSIRPKMVYIGLLALLSAGAILTRYSGLALVPAITLGLFFLAEDWKRKFSTALFYLGLTFLVTLPWFIRNRMVAGNVTNRSWEFHPITSDNLDQGIYNLSRLFIPVESIRRPIFKSGAWEWMLFLLFVGICIWAAILFFQLAASKKRDPSKIFNFTLLATFAAYFLAIFFSMSFFDNSTKLQDRIIAPGYLLFLLILVLSANTWLTKGAKWKVGLLGILGVVTLIFSLNATILEMLSLRSGGLGYASWKYRDNPVMLAVRELPKDVIVFTNSPPAVYLAADRATQVMPTAIDPVSNTLRTDYSDNLSAMLQQIESGAAVLALFNTSDLENSGFIEDNAKFLNEFTILKKGGDAVLFSR